MQETETAKHKRLTKDWQNANILDNFIFGKVMRNNDICKEFLELILKRKIKEIKIEVEKQIKEFIETRSIRLDVFAEGENEVYNIELQVQKVDSLQKRCRYYIDKIDMYLKPGVIECKVGKVYQGMKDVTIIFICNFDPVGLGLPQYTVERRYVESLETRFDDGTQIILLNATAYEKANNKNLRDFLAFINGKVEDIDNPLVNRIQKIIKTIKQDEKSKEKFMTLADLIEDERFFAVQENKEKNAISLLKLNKLTFEDIASSVGLTLEKVKDLHKSIKK